MTDKVTLGYNSVWFIGFFIIGMNSWNKHAVNGWDWSEQLRRVKQQIWGSREKKLFLFHKHMADWRYFSVMFGGNIAASTISSKVKEWTFNLGSSHSTNHFVSWYMCDPLNFEHLTNKKRQKCVQRQWTLEGAIEYRIGLTFRWKTKKCYNLKMSSFKDMGIYQIGRVLQKSYQTHKM